MYVSEILQYSEINLEKLQLFISYAGLGLIVYREVRTGISSRTNLRNRTYIRSRKNIRIRMNIRTRTNLRSRII